MGRGPGLATGWPLFGGRALDAGDATTDGVEGTFVLVLGDPLGEVDEGAEATLVEGTSALVAGPELTRESSDAPTGSPCSTGAPFV